jgi:zinc protease
MSTALTSGLSPVRTVLDNGAVVLAQETSTTPAVAINVTFKAGGVHESPSLPGVAYFVGRLLDRGSERRSGDAIAEELDDRGVALRITSTRHTTAATCTCLAEDFDEVLSIVLDAVSRPLFPETEIAKRRAELVSIIRRDEDNPAVRAVETFFEMLYGPTHPYGWRSKGTLEGVERITRQDLVNFHNARFRPAALSVALVGDVPGDHALERVAAELDGWTGAPPEDQPVPPTPARAPRRQRGVPMPGKSQTEIAYGFVAVRRQDPRFFSYWVMNNILGQFGLGGRLADNIRERQGMAYYAFSLFDPSVGDGPLLVRAGVAPSHVKRALAAIDFEVGRMAAEGPTPTELQETRQYLIGSVPRFLETNAGIAVFLQTAEQFELGIDYDQQLPRHLQAVTLEQVAAAAAEVLHPEHAVVSIAGPPASDREDAP